MPVGGTEVIPPGAGGGGSRPHYPSQQQPRPKRRRRNHSEVSCCLKYVIFGFNVIFWLIGLSILAIGVWAWTEKDTFNNLSLLTNVALDPAFIFIWAGTLCNRNCILSFHNTYLMFRSHYVCHWLHRLRWRLTRKHCLTGRLRNFFGHSTLT